MDSIPSYLLTSLALVGSPGPNTLSLAALGAAFGARRGLSFMAGLNLGMVGVLALIGSGLWLTLLSIPGLAPMIAAASTGYLVYLAYRIATAPPLNSSTAPTARPPRWPVGVALSLTNPKAYLAVAAVLSQYVLVPANGLLDQLVKAGLLLAVIIAVNILWLVFGARLAALVRSERAGRLVNIGFAAVLLLSVLAAVAL